MVNNQFLYEIETPESGIYFAHFVDDSKTVRTEEMMAEKKNKNETTFSSSKGEASVRIIGNPLVLMNCANKEKIGDLVHFDQQSLIYTFQSDKRTICFSQNKKVIGLVFRVVLLVVFSVW